MKEFFKDYQLLLEWYQSMGADVLLSDVPRNHYIDQTPGKFTIKKEPHALAVDVAAQRAQVDVFAPVIQQQVLASSVPVVPTQVPHTQVAPSSAAMVHKASALVASATQPTEMQHSGQLPLATTTRVQPTSPQSSRTQATHLSLGNHPAHSCSTLSQLRAAIENSTECGLIKAATHTVFSGGPAGASVMIIGEAPGADEDRVGLPFVGQSGQLLNAILASIGIDREKEVYISNIVPWRPPGNRPPTPAEIQYCLPFIQKHIELAKPKIMILLGGVAIKSLLNRSEGILKLRGQLFEYVCANGHTVAAMPTFHPSYIMRSPSQKAHVWRDMLRLKKWLSENA